MDYLVGFGDTIGDAVLNSTGLIGNWNAFLEVNDFDSWTPGLQAGKSVKIPDSAAIDLEAVRAFKMYPTCNASSETIYGLIEQIFEKLLTAAPATAPHITPSIPNTNEYYRVKYGETIGDVVLNATGNIANWESVLDANDFDWIPQLTAGQLVAIPADVKKDLNTNRALTAYPANNNSENDVYAQIDSIFAILSGADDWILRTGFWDDTGRWRDAKFWID